MKHATRLRLIACLFFALAAMAARADDPVLEDQFGAEFALEGPRGRAFAIVYANRAGSKLTKPWSEFLEAYADTVLVIGAANLDSAPRMARPFIRKAFDKAPPTLLDWKGGSRRATASRRKCRTFTFSTAVASCLARCPARAASRSWPRCAHCWSAFEAGRSSPGIHD